MSFSVEQMNRIYKILGIEDTHAYYGERLEPHIDRLIDELEKYVSSGVHPTRSGCGPTSTIIDEECV